MSELIKRSDVIFIIQNANYKYPTWPRIVEAKKNMIRDIESAPTVDAVPVVHGCDICLVSGLYVRGEDDYCPYGERKEGAE